MEIEFFKWCFKPGDESSVAVPKTNTNQVPAFLIPDILCNARAMSELATQIYNKSKQLRPIYVCYDKRFSMKDVPDASISVDEQAQQVKTAMTHKLPEGPIPYVIIGFSYGCSLAVKAAQELKANGQDVHLYLIDGIAPELTQTYFSSNDTTALNDLVSIINYAAQLASLEPIQIQQEDLKSLQFLNLSSRLEELTGYVLAADENKNASAENIQRFNNLAKIARQNLEGLMSSSTKDIKLDKVTLLLTNEMESKYNTQTGGWQNYTTTPESVVRTRHPQLEAQTHTNLLKPENAALIATSISEVLKSEIPKKQLVQKQIDFLIKEGESDEECESMEEAPSPPQLHILDSKTQTSTLLPFSVFAATKSTPNLKKIAENNTSPRGFDLS